MKLSEMNAAELAIALVKLAGHMEKICGDEQIYQMIADYRERVKASRAQNIAAGEFYAKLVPLLLGKHRVETFHILAVVNGVSVEEIFKMNGFQLLINLCQAWRRELMPFFTQCASGGKNA